MKWMRQISLFCLGGGGYIALEYLWRGWSYYSMFLAGGTCFLLLGALDCARPRLPLLPRACVGAGVILMVELAAGLVFNRSYRVWDYRGQPWNFHGQICLAYGLLWLPLSLGAMALYRAIDRCIPE